MRWGVALLAALLLTATARAEETVLLEQGSTVTYLANTSDPGFGFDWTAPGFTPGPEWQTGPVGVGYELAPQPGGAHGLIESYVPPSSRSIYLRTTFDVADPAQIGALGFGADYDDAYVVWLNGVEVFRTYELVYVNLAWNALPKTTHESSNGTVPDHGTIHDLSPTALPALVAGENVLAVAVFNLDTDDLVMAPKVVLDRPLRRGPYLQMGGHDRVTVRWRSARAGASTVWFGDAPDALDASVEVPGARVEHAVEVAGLEPARRYYYAIGDDAGVIAGGDADHYFDTPAPAGTAHPTRVWVLGDSGWGNKAAEAVRDAYRTYAGGAHTDLVLMLGDNAYPSGTDLEYQTNLFEIYPEELRQSVLWPTLGNHDHFDSAQQTWPYLDMFTLPTGGEVGGVASGSEHYYSFDWANIHFVVLDSLFTDRSETGPMLTWLESDLQATSAEWIVAFWHHPPYSKGGHDSDTELPLIEMRENALPLLESYGADLVLTGHSHSYERSNLVDGHYGVSATFHESMRIDGGDGAENGDGAYQGVGPGTVYAVAGSSSSLALGSAASLGGAGADHPVMELGLLLHGSMVLDIDGNRLDAVFLDETGAEADRFTIVKGDPPTAPVADFSAHAVLLEAPAAVAFSDQSVNAPTFWEWDFDGDGAADSGVSSPSHVYEEAGSYDVRLTVQNAAGSDTETKVGYICVTAGIPGEILGLAVAADKQSIGWAESFQSTRYELVRGSLDALRATGSFDGTWFQCADSPQASTVDTTVPAAGNAWYYLVRGINCAPQTGTYDTTGPGQAGTRDVPLQGSPGACSCPVGDDPDGDEYCGVADNCPNVASTDLGDADGDGQGNVCDTCPLDAGNDADADGLCANVDNCPAASNPGQADFDEDGAGDACDPDDDNDGLEDGLDFFPLDPFACRDIDLDACDDCSSGTNQPANDGPDADEDGLCDAGDGCTDVDGDGFGNGLLGDVDCPFPGTDLDDSDSQTCSDTDLDGCQDCGSGGFDPGNDGADADLDGICDLGDNCLTVANPGQLDLDLDGAGNACDPCTDQDGDGFGNPGHPANTCPEDNCPFTANPDQANGDADLQGDVCDPCPADPLNDADNDFVCGDVDNCPMQSNSSQSDYDLDGKGDVCDSCQDFDGDGFGDPGFPESTCQLDNCPDVANPDQENIDSDSLGNACDPDDDNDGYPDVDDPIPHNPQRCADVDEDGCDDCIIGLDGFGPLPDANPANDGPDFDMDGICTTGDNCPSIPNAGQEDADLDGIGDVCDTCNDVDQDGLGDGSLGNIGCVLTLVDADDSNPEACADTDGDGCDDCASSTFDPLADGLDADVDGICDAGDACPVDPFNDQDGDGLCNDADNCPSVGNPLQEDGDGDGRGDVCEFVHVTQVGAWISVTEVTNAEYTEFLNSVAAIDTHGLYSSVMASDPRGGIVRTGDSGSFTYQPKPMMRDKPVNFVSWLDAARYVNWLENGRPVGFQTVATTEDGAYDLTIPAPGADAVRRSGAGWYLPNQPEWDVAAYADLDLGMVWTYPTRSDAVPLGATADAVGAVANPGLNVANYGGTADWNGLDGNVTTVGSGGPLSVSYYGTYDQGGNVREWVENPGGAGSRVQRGGSFEDPSGLMMLGTGIAVSPSVEMANAGFRIAASATCADPDGDGHGSPAGPACSAGFLEDNCPATHNPEQDDHDGDGAGDACDDDDDGDGVLDAEDEAPLDANLCRDVDADTCDDCSGGFDDPFGDGPDFDDDGSCDAGDPDDDGDMVDDLDDQDPFDPSVCRDLDGDGCDDCTNGFDDPLQDGDDFDGDGACDLGDPDDDDDGVPDLQDGAPLDPNACRDIDSDLCDDCSSGIDAPDADGPDHDQDGACDVGDVDDDDDGVLDDDDCLPFLAGVAAPPDPVGDSLRLGKSGPAVTVLTWEPSYQGHTSNVYAYVRGTEERFDGDFACFRSELPAPGTSDGTGHPSGEAMYFLVTARNACGDSEPTPFGAAACPSLSSDTDSDGVSDLGDNCPLIANPSQADDDGDFVGDACEGP